MTFSRIFYKILLISLITLLSIHSLLSCSGNQDGNEKSGLLGKIESVFEDETPDEYIVLNSLLVLPANPAPGEKFRILATGGRNIKKAEIMVSGPSGIVESRSFKTGEELPCWRIDDFAAGPEGNYNATLMVDKKEVSHLEFTIASRGETSPKGVVWKTTRSWDSSTETIYSAWITALFQGCDEQKSWPALHEVTQNSENNFLYNHLSLDEDNPESKTRVLMEPDCADNPFFLRAYFAWKMGLPFGYHVCDRGYLGKNPGTGQWVTNESPTSRNNPVLAFNAFVRRIMDGVHSGTARTALDNKNSDYYPVSLNRSSLRPGTVFADPYGHTFVLVSWISQTKDEPGLLLASDAQPDGTVAIKRFWKGNFLFNTVDVIGEPGFKAFRPIVVENGKLILLKNDALTESSGYIPFSLQQQKMEREAFYHTMDRVINPKPLDPEEALTDLITALHEQLLVRVKSVENGEAYLKSHPGTVIPMPSNAKGVFQTGGLWEDFSTPNRDLRLLIAMDALLDFPQRVAGYPEDFQISKHNSTEEIQRKLKELLEEKVAELSIIYTRTDGSEQRLSLKEILERKDSFEMAYNPNDGIEIRWGAPENSAEISTCKRRSPAYQQKTMQSVRKWFSERLHPPT